VDGNPLLVDVVAPNGRHAGTYTIFEGTSEIQRLVIARAISGMHID
jgi:alkylation response protein AidB-like acyl-CoA dehydrogenase